MKPPRLIVVEDSQNDILLLKRIIKKMGTNVDLRCISDGAEAMEYLTSGEAKDACLVLMDLKMPKFTGLEILQEMKSQAMTRPIPVVMLTTSNQPKDIQAATANGANGYLVKPSDFQEFKNMVEAIFNYWLKYNQTE